MQCKICNSKNIQEIDVFTPYIDKDWSFELLECLNCSTRFALREDNVNYHEEFHSLQNTPYAPHYIVAEEIKKLLLSNSEVIHSMLEKKSLVIKDVLSYIKNKDKKISILEIGCSSGYVTAYLQKIGFKNTLGIDISESAINFACTTFGDFYALKEKKQQYDIIFHTGLIGCVDEPIQFLSHYLNLLNKNGVMLFNAPSVNSIKETNEIWVSTPPPDLIYLFKDDVFKQILDEKYKITIKKTLSPLVILKKYINMFKNQKNNTYPRNFYNKEVKKNKKSNYLLKSTISLIVVLLVKLKLLQHYSDDYGLIVRIKND